MSPDRKARIWRQILTGTLTIKVPGAGEIHAGPGAWLEEEAFRHVMKPEDRRRLGSTLADSLLQKRIGFVPEPGQIVVDPDAKAPGVAPPAPVKAPSVPTVPRDALLPQRVYSACAMPVAEAQFVVVGEGRDRDFPAAAIAECVRLLEREPGLDVAIPLHNTGHPICAPLARDEARSGALRLPGGRSPNTIAESLLSLAYAHTPLVPDDVACAVVRASAWESWQAGTLPRAKAATCLTAFAWARPGTVCRSWPDKAPAQPTHTLIQPVREAVARSRNPGLPVLFVCAGIGPVGGTQVILNLVDALNDRGDIAASFAHLFQGSIAHKFRARTAALPLSQAEMVRDIEERLGWPRGERAVVVATSFGSGALAKAICERRPHWTPAAFWQDREDLFERADGRAVRAASEFGEFLAISRAVSVSRWVAETARSELGVTADFTIIGPTVDPDFGGPRPPRKDGPVRILSMWRPMTPVRRGLPLLRETYERLAQKYGGCVSLELFGWPEDAPKGAVHHGHLDTRQVAALMREVDVVVEPSVIQGWGLPGLEAMASGACLVSTDCKGPRDYIDHEQTGLIVPHDGLFEAVCRVVDDEALRARLAAAGPTSVRSWGDVAGRWAEVIRSWV